MRNRFRHLRLAPRSSSRSPDVTLVAFLALVAKALMALTEAEEAAALLEAAAGAVRAAQAGDGTVSAATVAALGLPPAGYEPGANA